MIKTVKIASNEHAVAHRMRPTTDMDPSREAEILEVIRVGIRASSGALKERDQGFTQLSDCCLGDACDAAGAPDDDDCNANRSEHSSCMPVLCAAKTADSFMPAAELDIDA